MNATSADSASTRVVRRYWRRTENRAAWWPWGLLPLLGLLLLFLYGLFNTAPAIQEQTLDSVKQQLLDSGVAVDAVEADGRRIRISGITSDLDERQIRSIAKATECDTWVGNLVCPTAISVELAGETLPAAAAAVERTEPRFHDFDFSRNGEFVTLRGRVPSDLEKSRLVSRASADFASVVDELQVTGEPATHRYTGMTNRALEVLTRLRAGSVRWTTGKLSVDGQLSPEHEPVVRDLLASIDVESLSLQAIRSADDCNARFGSLLQQSEIRFKSGSAVIDSSSADLLGRLATLAVECPGNLTIAGHTDSVGDARMNQALSQSRAAAVREALTELGIVAQRLNARGYGESQPVADNSTTQGRAQNRRITIRLTDEI